MAKNYAIMRIEKLTTNNHFAKATNHNMRAYDNSVGVNENGICLKYGTTEYKDIKSNLELRNDIIATDTGHNVKKNRVRGFEILFAVNQEFMRHVAKREEYFQKAEEWVKETFGEENYLNHSIHMDEDGAPHMHAMVTCLSKDEKDGIRKYIANKWVSNRKSLSDLQDSWHSKVEHLGLERGQKAFYTQEKHKTKQEYLKLLEKDLKTVQNLATEERDLLAIKGMRQVAKEKEIATSMKSRETMKNIDYDELFESLGTETLEKSSECDLEI